MAWEYLKQFAAPLIESINETELRITLKTSAKIYLLGAEKADSLRGMYLDGAALDEFAQIKPSAVSQVILPCLSDRKGWLVYMGTPRGKNHFYDHHKKAQSTPGWYHMLLRASESGIIPQEELDMMKSQMDASDYLQEYECSFDAALKGAIYGYEMEAAEREGRVKPYELDPNLPLDVITDLGFTDDTVLIFFQIQRGGILIHEVLSENEHEWAYYLDEMDSREVRDVYLPHDAKAKNLQTGTSIVEQTLKRGYRPQIVPDHKLRDGIASTRRILPYCHWNQPLCSGAIEAMKSYRRVWDDKMLCYRDNPVHDWSSHVADAHRYLGVVADKIPQAQSKLILPPAYAREMNYGFALDDIWSTAPRLEQ